MNVVAELRPELRDDPREERGHFVEIGIVCCVAVHATETDALEELIDASAHGLIIDEADIGQHVRETFLAGIPARHQCAFVDTLITGHSCRLHGSGGSAWAASLAALSSSHR